MNVLPAQEIKRRGISAVDDALRHGAVHIIKNNRPEYVVLTEAGYSVLLEAQEELALVHIKAALEDVGAGRVSRHSNVELLMQQLDSEPAL